MKLTVYGDAISNKTGLGGNRIGFLMIATVASVPELASGISSVILAKAPDLAVSTILGACIYNLAIVVILDSLYRKGSLYNSLSQETYSFRRIRHYSDVPISCLSMASIVILKSAVRI